MNRHKEAYAVMLYRCKSGHEEFLWNTRDGVTPFGINCATCGEDAFHENWNADIQTLELTDQQVNRVFVDARPDQPHLIRAANEYVDKYWNDESYPMSQTFAPMDSKAAVQHFIKEWTRPGTPTIISRQEYEAVKDSR